MCKNDSMETTSNPNPFTENLAARGYTVNELRSEIIYWLEDTWTPKFDGIERFCMKVEGVELNAKAADVRRALKEAK